MFTIMPQNPPPFSFGWRHGQNGHRTTIPSPLSSSPIRASSVSPPPQQPTSQPLSPCGPNSLNTLPRQRETQSSPIFGSNSSSHGGSSGSSKFIRFAGRNPRPNPVMKRREDAQEGRRRLFLQNVRQRQEDKKWEMRGGEDELLKLEWWRLIRERQQAKEAEVEQYEAMMDADLMAQEEEELRRQEQQQRQQNGADADSDALMVDAIAQQEQADLDALVSALEGEEQGHGAPQFSDDEDYDGLFMDLIMQQEGQGVRHSQDVEMS